MKTVPMVLTAAVLVLLSSCPIDPGPEPGPPDPVVTNFAAHPLNLVISNERFYVGGSEFRLKCIGFEPFAPGESPESGDYPVAGDYAYALSKIRQANANAVYLLTGDPANLQPAFFSNARAQGLKIVLGLWFSAQADDYQGHSGDFQSPYFKAHVKKLITNFVNRYHSIGGVDYSQDILYVVLGNEMDPAIIAATDGAHPGVTSYSGQFVSIAGATPTECFFAEIADYFKKYESGNYGVIHAVTHHTWPVVSPDQLKLSFLDVISYNLYSYWPSFVSAHAPGSVTGTPYQGALEEILTNYPGKTFVVSEFGKSVAPLHDVNGGDATNEPGQAAEISNRWEDMITANRHVAGASVHQLTDQWWKEDHEVPAPVGVDKNEHDQTDREEWFGIIGVEGLISNYTNRLRPAYFMLSNLFQ